MQTRCGIYLLVERPFEQSVALSPHHHKEQGQVAATPSPIPIQVDPQAHLVAVFTGVEGWRGGKHVLSGKRLSAC